METANPADANTRLSRALAVGSVIGLIVLGLAWELWLAPTGRGTLAVKVLPLLPLIPGLVRYRMYSYRVLSLLVWLYVLEGLLRATSGEAMPVPLLAALETLLAITAFCACVLQVRWRLRRAGAS
jgi:uncharacterized membrane protein